MMTVILILLMPFMVAIKHQLFQFKLSKIVVLIFLIAKIMIMFTQMVNMSLKM